MVDDILIESFEGRSPSLRIAIVTETFPPEINGVAMTLGHIVHGLIARGHMVQVVRPRQARESGIVPGNMEEVLARGAACPTTANCASACLPRTAWCVCGRTSGPTWCMW